MRAVLWIPVLAALAALAWLLRATPGEPASEDPVEHRERDVARTGPALAGSVQPRASAASAPTGRARLIGRVTRHGQPAPARVQAFRAAPPTPSELTWVENLPWTRLRDHQAQGTAPTAVAETNAEGEFAFEDLATDTYFVLALGADGGRASGLARLATHAATLRLNLALSLETLGLDGLVVDTAGAPVSAAVGAVPVPLDDHDLPFLEASSPATSTAADGSVRLEGLPAGQVRVWARTSDGSLAWSRPYVVPSPSPCLVVFPLRGRQLEGRVVAAHDGSPVAGATLEFLVESNQEHAGWSLRAVSGPGGRFEALVPAREVQLVAQAAGFRPKIQYALARPGDLVVRLVRPARVEGRVLSAADGRPAVGAVVRVRDGEGTPVSTTAVADSEGRYALPDLPPGLPRVCVLGGGWATPGLGQGSTELDWARHALVAPEGAVQVRDLSAEPLGRLSGRVLDPEGRPVSGASIFPKQQDGEGGLEWLDSEQHLLFAVASDARGEFLLDTLPVGYATDLGVRAAGHPELTALGLVIPAQSGPPLELRLLAPRRVDVQVLAEPGGEPLAGVSVFLTLHVEAEDESTDVGRQLTEADGIARFEAVGAGRVEAGAMAAGLLPIPPTDALPAPGGDGRTLRAVLRAQRGRRLRGTVVRTDGTPGFPAQVRASSADKRQFRRSTGPTRPDGSFELVGLPPDALYVVAVDDQTRGEQLLVEPGSDGVRLTLPVPAPVEAQRPLRVRVTGPDGQPLPSFSVNLSTRGSSMGTEGSEGLAEFEIGAPPPESVAGLGLARGDFRLEVSDPRGADGLALPLAPALLDLRSLEPREVEVRLAPGPVLEGRVLGPQGQGQPGVWITAEPVNEPGESTVLAGDQALTDAQGRFRFARLHARKAQLRVHAPRGTAISSDVIWARPGDAPLEIRLQRAVRVRVRVLTPEGRPLHGANVAVEARDADEAHDAHWEETDREGYATLEGLDPERAWTLTVDPWDRDDLRSLHVSPWRPEDGDVVLPRALSVQGVVLDSTGAPARNARVHARQRDLNISCSASTEADGTFTVMGLAPGPVELSVRHGALLSDEAAADPRPVTVQAGATDLSLRLAPSRTLTVRLEGLPTGHRASVALRLLVGRDATWTSGGEVSARAKEGSATYVLVGLDLEAPLALVVMDESSGCVAFAEVPPAAQEVVVRTTAALSIRGRVLGLPPGERASVWAADARGVHATGECKLDGSYSIRTLPPGRYHVHARFSDDDRRVLNGVGEAGAGETLDVTLVPSPR